MSYIVLYQYNDNVTTHIKKFNTYAEMLAFVAETAKSINRQARHIFEIEREIEIEVSLNTYVAGALVNATPKPLWEK